MDRRLVIIDGNSLINRAYYAMQRPMITKEGLYTQGVYGFLNMLTKIFTDYEPGYIAVTFDRKAPTFRHLEYEEYKAGRKKMPPELAMQLPLLKEVLGAMNIKMLEIDGFEADDIIGTAAVRAEAQGLEPLIITGDKDELQLATDITKIIITRKGISEFEIYDRNAMIEKYGFTPQQFIDYKGLMGDQSDNIPGIPGVGEKTAAKLILEYGSVENLIASAPEIKNQKLREKVEENAQLAMMSKRLATINTNVPMEMNFEEFKVTEPDYDKLIDIYIKLEFNSFLKKLKKNGEIPAQDEKASETALKGPEKASEIIVADNDNSIGEMLSNIEKSAGIVLKVLSDGSHKYTPEIYGISIMVNNKLYYIKGSDSEIIKFVLTALNKNNTAIAGHNLKQDYYALLSNYSEVFEDGSKACFNTSSDTAIAAYLLEPSRSTYDITALSYEYFHEKIESEADFFAEHSQTSFFSDMTDDYSKYALKWCNAAAALVAVIEEKLAKENLIKVYKEAELPLVEVLASMEVCGFKVDKEELTRSSSDISSRIDELTEKIHELAGEEFNINSTQQLGIVLFEKLGLPAGKKTKTGYSTSAEILEKLKDKHPIIEYILEYRMLSKLRSTYIEGLLPLIADDGKIHAHFQQTVTATGRISCTEPNLQNIPIRQELGRKIRKAFIPDAEGKVLTGADYSQIELRVLAHMSGDSHLIEAFNNGEDIHRSTAAKVFEIPIEEVTSKERSAAKAVNFGVIYGMSSFGLSTEINVSRKEAENYINEYFRRFPDVKNFMDTQVAFCKENGYVETILGRKRTIHEITASAYMVRQLGERLAMNSPIQGSAADIIKLAMIAVYRRLRSEGYKSKLILQVHDELIIETVPDEKERVIALLTECMESVMSLKVKLTAGVSAGDNWYELK